MRRVRRTGCEVQEERLIGRDLLGRGNELDSLVSQVLGQVVALLGCLGRLDLVGVVDQVGVILVGVAAQEAIVALEAPSQWPAFVGAGGRLLFGRRQVILAEQVGVVALQQQHLREEPVLEGDVAVVAGIAGGRLGDARHGVGVVVTPGEDARTRRRAQRRSVHVRVTQTSGGQCVQRGRLDGAAITAELAVASIIEHDK